jgi:uncharacterized membrane protein YeiH
MDSSLYILDLLGTFAFAISGSFRAIRHELDMLGMIVLAIITGVGGGVIRDLILGATPPTVFVDQAYIGICMVAALISFYAAPRIASRWNYVQIADAIGLGVFVAIGASKADLMGSVPLTILILAVITACGGGVLRDILVSEVPLILRVDFYASAAIVGGLTYIGCDVIGVAPVWKIVTTILVTYLIRVLAMRFKFSLPRAKMLEASPSEIAQRKKTEKKRR